MYSQQFVKLLPRMISYYFQIVKLLPACRISSKLSNYLQVVELHASKYAFQLLVKLYLFQQLVHVFPTLKQNMSVDLSYYSKVKNQLYKLLSMHYVHAQQEVQETVLVCCYILKACTRYISAEFAVLYKSAYGHLPFVHTLPQETIVD